jgi:hypothetical protein
MIQDLLSAGSFSFTAINVDVLGTSSDTSPFQIRKLLMQARQRTNI